MRKMRLFGKGLVQHAVQRARRGEVAAERLLDDHARVRGAARLGELARRRPETCSGGIAR